MDNQAMTPQLLQPEEIDRFWSFLQPGLRAVQETDETVEWTIESINHIAKKGDAYTVLAVKGDVAVGFFIGYPQPDGAFFVWVGHLHLGYDLGEGMDMMAAFAKDLGCTRLIFGTNRRGWERIAVKYGFRPTYWEKAI
jgi:hypothetical protein